MVSVAMGTEHPTGSRDLGGLQGAKGDLGSNAIKLGLAVGGK